MLLLLVIRVNFHVVMMIIPTGVTTSEHFRVTEACLEYESSTREILKVDNDDFHEQSTKKLSLKVDFVLLLLVIRVNFHVFMMIIPTGSLHLSMSG